MNTLTKIADGLWTISVPSKFLLFHVGTRMTVVRLASGDLLLHSPVTITEKLKEELAQLGKVSHIVCPNNFHHLYADQALSAYPDAKLHGPLALHKKRKDLSFDTVLSESAHADWQDDLIPLTIKGSMMHEMVFFHPSSKTLITSDIVENFASSPHFLTRVWLKLGGCHGHISWPRVLRLVYINRKESRKSFKKMFEFPFEKVIVAHGDIIHSDAHKKLKEGLSWID